MSERPLRIIVAAENIPREGTGLGYFLPTAVYKLAVAQPSWQFKIVTSSSFQELTQIQLPNVKLIFFDQRLSQRTLKRILGKSFPKSYISAGSYVLSRYVPSQWLKSKFGDLKALYGEIRDADLVWLPHYAIGESERFSSLNNLSSVRAPILLTIHDIHPVFFPDDWSIKQLEAFWKGFVTFAKRSQCIITHTQFQKTAIVEHLRIEPDKILVTQCPPLLDPAEFLKQYDKTEIEALLSRYHISPPFAFYPGSGSYTHKNHTRLLLAWAELKKRLGSKCPMLVCTAKGHLYPALKALMDALGLQDSVVFTDTVDTGTLTKLYQSCTFVIVPTLYEGGGSGPVAEAILSGKPVVCSRIPQIEEQLQAYGLNLDNSCVTFFTPDSVDSIVQATEYNIQRLPELETQAQKDQILLSSREPKLWDEWAAFYTEQIRIIARK